MHLLREWERTVLSLAAVASIALGVWLVALQVRALVDEAHGKCDFIPCVNGATVPELIGGGGLVLIGATAGALLIRGRHRQRRKASAS